MAAAGHSALLSSASLLPAFSSLASLPLLPALSLVRASSAPSSSPSVCEHAEAHGARKLASSRSVHAAFLHSEVKRLLRYGGLRALGAMLPSDICRLRVLFYRGDDNYGLGNVLYDISSAAAMAILLNRTLIYGRDAADRKFGTLLTWPDVPTMRELDALHDRASCGSPVPSSQRRVLLSPDRCTFQKTWRKEQRGDGKCFRRLHATNWLAERAAVLELTKSHAYTGVQTLLKSTHRPLRERAAALVGGCLQGSARPNSFGHLLAALMRPSPPVMHALRWALSGRSEGSTHRRHRRPHLALHVRAMSGHRARNLSSSERAAQLTNSLACLAHATDFVKASRRRPVVAVIVSSSPEVREGLVARLAQTTFDGMRIEPLVFDWRAYMRQAPPAFAAQLAASQEAAHSFCANSKPSEHHRCNSSAHLQDWGPAPHWVAVVELLLVASVSGSVIGGGFPYFKVCNTFVQIGAALAQASPWWLCARGHTAAENSMSSDRRCSKSPPTQIRFICASQLFATDWGSSAWRMFDANARRGASPVLKCSAARCMSTPLQPELWNDLAQNGGCLLDKKNIPLFTRAKSAAGSVDLL
ncbi:MAG: hypothetical protein SGPRY_000130 [Prymnesium sp.]